METCMCTKQQMLRKLKISFQNVYPTAMDVSKDLAKIYMVTMAKTLKKRLKKKLTNSTDQPKCPDVLIKDNLKLAKRANS